MLVESLLPNHLYKSNYYVPDTISFTKNLDITLFFCII